MNIIFQEFQIWWFLLFLCRFCLRLVWKVEIYLKSNLMHTFFQVNAFLCKVSMCSVWLHMRLILQWHTSHCILLIYFSSLIFVYRKKNVIQMTYMTLVMVMGNYIDKDNVDKPLMIFKKDFLQKEYDKILLIKIILSYSHVHFYKRYTLYGQY